MAAWDLVLFTLLNRDTFDLILLKHFKEDPFNILERKHRELSESEMLIVLIKVKNFLFPFQAVCPVNRSFHLVSTSLSFCTLYFYILSNKNHEASEYYFCILIENANIILTNIELDYLLIEST